MNADDVERAMLAVERQQTPPGKSWWTVAVVLVGEVRRLRAELERVQRDLDRRDYYPE